MGLNQVGTFGRCNFIPIFFAKLLKLCYWTWKGLSVPNPGATWQILHWIEVWALIWPLKNINLVVFEQLLWCFRSLFCWKRNLIPIGSSLVDWIQYFPIFGCIHFTLGTASCCHRHASLWGLCVCGDVKCLHPANLAFCSDDTKIEPSGHQTIRIKHLTSDSPTCLCVNSSHYLMSFLRLWLSLCHCPIMFWLVNNLSTVLCRVSPSSATEAFNSFR